MSKDQLNLIRSSHEKRKLQLKNPNCFVSPTRLCMLNIPKDFDKTKLRGLFLNAAAQASGEAPRIKQTKLAFNKRGQSLGYAFVEFEEHDHALHALRYLNNNPSIFKNRRPIVQFSIENILKVRKLKHSMQV